VPLSNSFEIDAEGHSEVTAKPFAASQEWAGFVLVGV
jgi:hypothetical protein